MRRLRSAGRYRGRFLVWLTTGNTLHFAFHCADHSIANQLRRLWEIEEAALLAATLIKDETGGEAVFCDTHFHGCNGIHRVSTLYPISDLRYSPSATELDDSVKFALRRVCSI